MGIVKISRVTMGANQIVGSTELRTAGGPQVVGDRRRLLATSVGIFAGRGSRVRTLTHRVLAIAAIYVAVITNTNRDGVNE